jgi:SAM-dependent methyltransferase
MRERVKQALGPAGVDVLRKRRRSLEVAALHAALRRRGWTTESLAMTDEQAAIHFANEVAVDEFSRLVIRIFHQFKIEFLQERLGRSYIDAHSFFEIGDSDGLLLKALGKTGDSINNDPRCIELIGSNGINATLGLGERLDVPDKSYDVVMSFETLEHSLDPIGFLRQMARVAREKVVISIPGVTRTMIHPRIKGARVGEEHVFELCSRDLVKLATHLPLRLAHFSKFPVFETPGGPLAGLFYLATRGRDLFGSCFRWFDFYVFDVVNDDQGRTAAESSAVYDER